MATLSSIARKALPKGDFALPGRKYPIPPGDKAHAANAKGRVTQQVKKGNATPAQKREVDAKANRVLGKK